MELNSLPKQSGRIKLQDVDPYLALTEGPVTEDTAAWVVIKVASTDENRRYDDVLRVIERHYHKADDALVYSEVDRATDAERAEIAVYLSLMDAGNITANGEPVFKALPVRKMEYDEWQRLWRSLPLDISRAIYMAVLSVNRAWSVE